MEIDNYQDYDRSLHRSDIKEAVKMVLRLFDENERMEKKIDEQEKYIDDLNAEIRRLRYEYPDSKLKRDTPLPYKWTKKGGHFLMFCPKCEMMIANWYNYCHSCGQKIGKGNPLPEMEVKE